MAKRTLYNKVWDKHKIALLENGQEQILVSLMLMHEVTSPQAFAMLREKGGKVKYPNRVFATVDHVVPTHDLSRPYQDPQAELMAQTIAKNTKDFGINYFGVESGKQGVIHIMGPERGLTQPGMIIVCGDSHTATHGAFGALAFGIGTTQILHVLETQTLALNPLKVRKIEFNGNLQKGVYAKDVILRVLQKLGVKGGLGYAYEFSGDTFSAMSMEERMTVCNMTIEAGARIGYINPDEITFDYLRDKEYAPKGPDFEKAVARWKTLPSEPDAEYDDVVSFRAEDLEPMITWGITPGQVIPITGKVPTLDQVAPEDKKITEYAYKYMKMKPGQEMLGMPLDVVFIGSCTNGRIEDLRIAAEVLKGKRVSSSLKCLVVPGSQEVKIQAEKEGLDKIFIEAGAEWRYAGCSMCLAMNPDKLVGSEISASTSNRNFIGRQGSPTGRTLLVSPAAAAAIAIAGKVVDPRDYL
ncbi:3-isopropylmalate dehydratase large subunit [Candidatus Margulisiibacteriota bacterium]